MPLYKITETTLGNAERVRIGYIEASDSDHAIELSESGSVFYDEDKINISDSTIIINSEEIKVN